MIVQTVDDYTEPGSHILNPGVKGPVLKITYAACDVYGNCSICKVDEPKPEPKKDVRYILVTLDQDEESKAQGLNITYRTQFSCKRPTPAADDYIRVDVVIKCEDSTVVCLWHMQHNHRHTDADSIPYRIGYIVLTVCCFMSCVLGRVLFIPYIIKWVIRIIFRIVCIFLDQAIGSRTESRSTITVKTHTTQRLISPLQAPSRV